MKIEIDPQLHEKKIEELASQIRRCAEESGRRPEHVGRARFLAWRGPGEGLRFVKAYWAPAKERATGGAVPAPPIDPIPAGHAVKGVAFALMATLADYFDDETPAEPEDEVA